MATENQKGKRKAPRVFPRALVERLACMGAMGHPRVAVEACAALRIAAPVNLTSAASAMGPLGALVESIRDGLAKVDPGEASERDTTADDGQRWRRELATQLCNIAEAARLLADAAEVLGPQVDAEAWAAQVEALREEAT